MSDGIVRAHLPRDFYDEVAPQRRRCSRSRHCEAQGCNRVTAEAKKFCPGHITLDPWIASIAAWVEEDLAWEEREKKKAEKRAARIAAKHLKRDAS
jgi:hypothetical protein